MLFPLYGAVGGRAKILSSHLQIEWPLRRIYTNKAMAGTEMKLINRKEFSFQKSEVVIAIPQQ